MNKINKMVLVAGSVLVPVSVFAEDANLTAFTTSISGKAADLATMIGSVAGAALAIMGIFYGIRLAVRAFKSVK